MPKIGDISVEVPSGGTNHVDTPAEFLYENQSQITDATSLLSDGRITSIPSDVTTVLETSPGLSASAFNVGGNAPLNAVAEKFASSTSTEYELFNSLKSTIESDANRHMVEEGGQNYVVIFTKYKELIEEVTEAVNAYNADRDAGSEEVRTDDSEDTITRKKYYPECSFSCSMTSPPTISFKSIATTNTSRTVSASESPHYEALKEAYDKAKAFYDRYCEDAIAFKDATSGLMAEGEAYDFETDLTKLENDWPEGVGATETPTEEEKKEEKEEEKKEEEKTEEKEEEKKEEKEEEKTDEGGESPEETSAKANQTYKSGDALNVDGNLYYYYGTHQAKDGSVTNILVDTAGYMCYVNADGKVERLKATYTDGSGHNQTKQEITQQDYENGININARGFNVHIPYTLEKDGEKIPSGTMASSVTQENPIGEKTEYGRESYLPDNDKAVIEEHYESMAGKDPGVQNAGTTHETTTHVATDVHAFSNSDNTKDGNTIIVPQGTKFQWDQSGAPLNGHDFDTSSGAVYLQYSEKDGGYYQVDEYGNRVDSQIYSVEGFNTEYGNFN